MDPVVGPVKAALVVGKVPVPTKTDPSGVTLLCRESSKLDLKDGILLLSHTHNQAERLIFTTTHFTSKISSRNSKITS